VEIPQGGRDGPQWDEWIRRDAHGWKLEEGARRGGQATASGRMDSRSSQNEHPAARSDWIRAGGQQTAAGRPAAELNSRSGVLSEP